MKETDWRTWKIGTKIIFSGKEFGQKFRFIGTVSESYPDHLIARADGMSLWIDEDNYRYYREVR